MKFNQYECVTDRLGFKYARKDVMLTNKKKPCLQCGAPTLFVEVFSEAYFCSDECIDAFYKENKI